MPQTASKTPSKLFVPILAGLSDHIGDGRVTRDMFCVYWTMLHGADYETGIWKGCAEKIRFYWNGNFEIRAVQRAMRALYEGGYAKSFQRNGERGNYPVAINKYPVRFGIHKGKCLNAGLTPDPEHRVYEDDPRQPNEEQAKSQAPRPRNSRGRIRGEDDRVGCGVNDRDNDSDATLVTKTESTDYGDLDRDSEGVNDRDMSPATKPTTKPTTKPASLMHSIPDVPEGLDDPDLVAGVVEGEKPTLALSINQRPVGNEQASLLSDMRTIYDHHRVGATWNTTPAHETRAAELAAVHGKRIFLQAFDAWCYHDASDQIETKNYDSLKFPVQKFFGQIDHYKNVASGDTKRRSRQEACPIVREREVA